MEVFCRRLKVSSAGGVLDAEGQLLVSLTQSRSLVVLSEGRVSSCVKKREKGMERYEQGEQIKAERSQTAVMEGCTLRVVESRTF